MRLVAAAAAFLLGAAAALGFDLAPGLKIPAAAFYLLLVASIIGVAGALLAGRRLGVGLLVLIALLGMWRGGHAAADDIRDGWYGVPETPGVVTIEGELLTDPAPANFNTRLRLDVVAATWTASVTTRSSKWTCSPTGLPTPPARERPADRSTDSDTETATSYRDLTNRLPEAASPSQAGFR